MTTEELRQKCLECPVRGNCIKKVISEDGGFRTYHRCGIDILVTIDLKKVLKVRGEYHRPTA